MSDIIEDIAQYGSVVVLGLIALGLIIAGRNITELRAGISYQPKVYRR